MKKAFIIVLLMVLGGSLKAEDTLVSSILEPQGMTQHPNENQMLLLTGKTFVCMDIWDYFSVLMSSPECRADRRCISRMTQLRNGLWRYAKCEEVLSPKDIQKIQGFRE